MVLFTTNFSGDPNIGLYGFATDSCCFLGRRTKINKRISKTLNVPVRVCTMLNTEMSGIFSAGNSSGIMVPKIIEEYEIDVVRKLFENVLVIKSRYNALGNLVLMNDKGIIISPLLKKNRTHMKEFFGIPCEVSTVAGMNVVGAVAAATNKGCLAHPKIKTKEAAVLGDVLDVNIDIGTVNFGSRFVKSGLLANSNGFVASEASSGPELGRINEALGFL